MTDPELADRTYVEPLTVEVLDGDHRARAARRDAADGRRPDRAQPRGRSRERRHAREVRRRADRRVDRGDQGRRGSAAVQGRDAGDRPRRAAERPRAHRWPRRSSSRETLGFPLVIRPSFTLGGVGGGIAYNIEEFRELAERGLELSPVHEVLIEESVIGWKEFELEVMRDVADNFVVICSIENIDPMGVHTGDSITVAPILTLTRQGIPADARRGAPHHPQGRRRDGRLEHPVRRQSGRRPDGRHRDEPARVALVGARVEGDRLSDREDRRQARARLSPRRDPQRHHAAHAARRSSRPSTTSSSRSRGGTSRSSRRPTAR